MPTLRQKICLLTGLLAGQKTYSGPWFIAVDVTRRCNLHCLGCISHSPLLTDPGAPKDTGPADISNDLFGSVCKQMADLGPGEIILIGEGEPLLHPNIVAMVRQAKTYGHSTRMVTNGTLLNGAVAKELVEAGLDRITISFWATTPEQAEKVYLRTGAETFASQLAGLDNLAEAKRRSGKKHPLVSLHQPLSKYSVDGAEQLVDLAREHGAQRVTFSPLRTKGGRLTDHAPDYEQMKSLNALRARLQSDAMGEGIDEFLLRLEIGEQVWLRMPCYVGWHHLRVDLAGRVFSCKMCRTPIGDLTMSSLREIWNGEPLQKFRRQTRTRRRLAAFRQDCECEHCCHAVTNHRMQQVLRWIDPRSRF